MLFFRRQAVLLCVLAAALTGWVGVSRGDKPAVANIDVLDKLTGLVVSELYTEMPSAASARAITLSPLGTDERYDFISNVFTRVLTENGYRVFKSPRKNIAVDSLGAYRSPSAGSNAPADGFRLEYQALDFTLRYTKIYRSHLIGGKKVKRRADVRILATLFDESDGAVVWTGEALQSQEDQFPYGQLAEVEAGLFAFSKPPRESKSWGKVVEPVVVTGIIVGLIYLFFSNQSDK